MLLVPIKRMALVATCAVAVISCDESGTTPVTIPAPPTLGTGLWYLNTVGDSALGSTIATRTVGAAQERTVVDSGWLDISPAGTYEQRYWLRIFVTGLLDRTETVIDLGAVSLTGVTYTFTSSVRPRTFTVSTATADRVTTAEPMVFFADPPITQGSYSRTRP